MNRVYLIIGSNIDPESNIPTAVRNLQARSELKIINMSSVWKTRSVGVQASDFLNIALCLDTTLDQRHLKDNVLSVIENKMGRVRSEDKFAPRPIDLDIVIFNDSIVDSNLFKYDYLILPFAEMIPELMSTVHGIDLQTLASSISPFSTAHKVDLQLPKLL